MKKVIKIITLVLVVVMLCSVLTGCAMFGKNLEKYRATTIVKVGTQKITIGELLDSFNTQYNNYYSYIANGYITVEYVFELALDSLYQQAVKVDNYVSNHDAETTNKTYVNGEYLTQEELDFVVTYVKYLVFTNFDAQVESFLSNDFEFEEVEEEDTSRDFTEPDDLDGQTYANYVYSQNFVNEDMDEYFADNYPSLVASLAKDNSIDGYKFKDEASAQNMLNEYNDRLADDATKVTFEDLQKTQEKVVRLYTDSILVSYGCDMQTFVQGQVESMVKSIIVAKHNRDIYIGIEGADKAETVAALTANSKDLAASQSADYILNNNFDSFITALTDTSYIYAVDEAEASKYIFVKNVLVPFTDVQTKKLANLATILGGTDSEEYLAERQKMAAEIIADDFNSEKDADGNYAKVEGLFALDNGNLVINPNGAMKDILLADGSVAGATVADKTANVVALMKQYNTDVGQHTSTYDYVVRVEDDANYTQPWVSEFVDAAKDAKAKGIGSYSICVSSYGVHIVYYSADVTVQSLKETDFNSVIGSSVVDTTTPAYKLFKEYFDSQSTTLVTENLDDLLDEYFHAYEEGKLVEKTKEFDKFLKENEIDFDFETLVDPLAESEEEDHTGHDHD